jgi:hypothetical protein
MHAADMTAENVVKITTYLSDRSYGQESQEFSVKSSAIWRPLRPLLLLEFSIVRGSWK